MDIIDIILAKALSPQGSIEAAAAKAVEAVTTATAAVTKAETAVTTAESVINAATSAALAANGAVKAFVPYNAYDVLPLLQRTTTTMNGITYTWNTDDTCTVTGTCTSDQGSQYLFYLNYEQLPYGIFPGETYRIFFTRNTQQVLFHVLQHDEDGKNLASNYFSGNGTITLNPNVKGIRIRLYVQAGATDLNDTVSVQMVSGLSHAELYDLITNATFSAKNLLTENTDFNTLKQVGYYTVRGSQSYINAPWPVSPSAAILEVLPGLNGVILQRITDRVTGKMYYRESLNGEFTYEEGGETKSYPWTEMANSNDLTTITNYIDTLEERIAALEAGGGSGGGSTNLGPEHAGHIVIIDENGEITWSHIAEQELIDALIKSGDYVVSNAAGVVADYENRVFTRASSEEDLNKFPMFGGRLRCCVGDDGTIIAFDGQAQFRDDGSRGQVMVYQPKFYYKRTILDSSPAALGGQVVTKESLLISPVAQAGFKIHPLFINEQGEEVDYVLLSAYEGSAYINTTGEYDDNDVSTVDFSVDKLSSITGVKPITGANKHFTIAAAEQMAKNRGTGWHITNMAFESASQMLMVAEFGSFNGQNSLELGVCKANNDMRYNCAVYTGSTSHLHNESGHADSSWQNINGVETELTENGTRAISYRGLENPWGNTWRFVGGVNIYGDSSLGSGMPYICNSFNYTTDSNTGYSPINFCLPNTANWISNFGYGSSDYDWVLMPILCSSSANSAVPVGDNLGTTARLNGIHILTCGGPWHFEENDGPFYYGSDQSPNYYARSFNARLMYIPQKNSIYLNNIAKWTAIMGGN